MATIKPQDIKVDTPIAAYNDMAVKWDLLHALIGGTTTMREKGVTYLPKETNESQPAYDVRKARSFLYPGYSDTIGKIIAKPFSKHVILHETEVLPDSLQGIEANADLSGRSLSQFSLDIFEAGIVYGLTHVLVDFPQNDAETLAQEREAGLRPHYIHVPPPQLIGWRYETLTNGEILLTQVRVYEEEMVPDGDYGEVMLRRVRVYTPDTFEVWEKLGDEEDEYTKVHEGTHTFGRIPLFTYYVNRKGVLTAEPPLFDLAETNLAHWQSSSDQRNILRYSRMAILFGSGMPDKVITDGIQLGADQATLVSAENADLKYVEHTGAAIEAGERDLERLERQMEVLGLMPFVRQTGSLTATEKSIDEAKAHTEIQTWIRGMEVFIVTLYTAAAKWVGTEIPEDFRADINNDFGISLRGAEDTQALITMKQAGLITHKTLLIEAKRRGLLREDLDLDTEILEVTEEGPPLGTIGTDDDINKGETD